MMKNFKRGLLATALGGLFLSGGLGCASHAGNGALLGGAIGAGTGAIIGHNSHGRTAGGALIGGAIGALAGGAIGDAQDREERGRYRERYDDRPPVRVERYEYRRYEPDCPPDYYEYRSYRSSGGYGGGYTEYRRYGY